MNTNTSTTNGMPSFFAGQPDAPSIDSLKEQFGCDHETAAELLELAETGFYYGKKGYWSDGDFASDADWVYGTGDHISMLEFRLETEDDDLFEVFQDAHAAGLEWFEKNSN